MFIFYLEKNLQTRLLKLLLYSMCGHLSYQTDLKFCNICLVLSDHHTSLNIIASLVKCIV